MILHRHTARTPDYWLAYKRGERFDWNRLVREHHDDVAAVRSIISRDATGIDYEIRLVLRSAGVPVSIRGVTVWYTRVDFGQTDASTAGGAAFVIASREQDEIAETIAAIVWRGDR